MIENKILSFFKKTKNRDFETYVSLLEVSELIKEANKLIKLVEEKSLSKDDVIFAKIVIKEFLKRIKKDSIARFSDLAK